MDDDLFMCTQCGSYANFDEAQEREPGPCKACEKCLNLHAKDEACLCLVCKDHPGNTPHTDEKLDI
jgi:transcription initiation factor IIE alpha subunit